MTPAVRRICSSVFPPPVLGKAIGALRKMAISQESDLWEGAERFLLKGNADVVIVRQDQGVFPVYYVNGVICLWRVIWHLLFFFDRYGWD